MATPPRKKPTPVAVAEPVTHTQSVPQAAASTAKSERIFKWLFIGLSGLLALLMPVLSLSHGQNGDEWSLILYGHDIYDYFFAGSNKALDYNVLNWLQVEGLHLYGGLYDFSVTFLHKTFFAGTDELTFRHIINSLVGAALFLYTGLIGKEFGGWRTGFLALLFIALSPRLFGESMNNPKDIPFAFANAFVLYYLIRFLRHYPARRWRYAVLMGVGFGLAMGFRIGGIILLPYAALFTAGYYFLNADFRNRVKPALGKHLGQGAVLFAAVVAIGWIIGVMFWPWALQDAISNPLVALEEMTQRQIQLQILFEGEYISNMDVPWYYTLKWISISNPLIVLITALASLVMLRAMMGRYGRWPVLMLVFTAIFPWAYAAYKESTLHDTWRHFFFVYPGIAVLGALFSNWLLERTAGMPAAFWGTAAVLAIGLALPLAHTLRNHPNEYVYFNEAVGGAQGAKAQYDFDYYQNGGKQMAEWIKRQPQKPGGAKTIVRSDLSGIEKYFPDTARYNASYLRFAARDTADWDYYISYSRYQPVEILEADLWPPSIAAHILRVDGVPIGAVLKRRSKASIAGYRALAANDYDAALASFGEFLQAETDNAQVLAIYGQLQASKGQFGPALLTLQKAKRYDPGNPQLDQLIGAVQAAAAQSPPPAAPAQ